MLNTHFPVARPLGLALLATLVWLSSPMTAQRIAEPPALLRSVNDVPVSARAWDAREKTLNPTIQRSRFVSVDLAALRQAGGAVAADLFGERVVLDAGEPQPVLGYELWSGSERTSGGTFILAAATDGVVSGVIRCGDRLLALAYADAPGVHVLQELDAGREALPFAVRSPDVDTIIGGGEGPTSAGSTILDVMVFYTPLARQSAGGTSAIETLIVNGIAQASRTNTNSALDATFRLVYVAETNYVEDSSSDLGRFRTNGDGFMDEVHALRSVYGGDLMHLITQPPSPGYCGVAYLMTSLSTGFRQWSFGVTLRSCISGNVICHELGHNIGCHHDRDNAGNAIYPYAYGYRTPDNAYRTVMSYSPGTRVDVWSSPNVQFQTYTMGVANSEDNVRTITNTKATVRAFYATTTYEWECIEGGVGSPLGEPILRGEGTVNGAAPVRIRVLRYWPNAPGVLLLGTSELGVSLFGGTLVPSPDFAVPIIGDATADIVVPGSWLHRVPAGVAVWLQAVFASPGPQGFSMSDGLKVVGL